MAFRQTEIWCDVRLDGLVTGLHVRWWEGEQLLKHDEEWPDPLTPEEAESILDLVRATI